MLRPFRDEEGDNFEVADLSQRMEFNCPDTNIRRKKFRIRIGEFEEAGEGVS